MNTKDVNKTGFMKTKKSIKKAIADYLRSKNANINDVKEIIDKCNQWITNSKNKQIELINKQIEELNDMKSELLK